MKVGSLVEFIGNPDEYAVQIQRNVIYTVRDVFTDPPTGDELIALEEIICPINPELGLERGFDAVDFRELQPPMDITELVEECQTLLIEI